MATDQAPINEDDDLFNFDDLNVGSARASVVASLPAPAAVSAAAAESPPAAVPARAPVRAAVKAPHVLVAPVAAAAPPSRPQGGRSQALGDHPLAPAVSAPPVAVHSTAAQLPLVKAVEFKPFTPPVSIAAKNRGARKRPGVVTISLLSLAVLFNIGLAGIVWRSMSKASPDTKTEGQQPAHVDEPVARDVPKPPSPWKDLEIKAPSSSEGESTLATAAEEIRRGEYERARARIYSLLAVIDRFDVALRPNLAARAQVLAADAYREQADAVEHQALASLESLGLQGEAAHKRP